MSGAAKAASPRQYRRKIPVPVACHYRLQGIAPPIRTGALLDRLTHHVHILEMNGESFRLKQSKNKNKT